MTALQDWLSTIARSTRAAIKAVICDASRGA